MSNPRPSPRPKDRTLFARLMADCLRTSCKCSHRATVSSSNNPKHDSDCPYTPNRSFQAANEYRQLKVRTFLNTIIALTPVPTPPEHPGIAHQRGQDPSKKHKRVAFHAGVTSLPPIDENPDSSLITNNGSNANATAQTFNAYTTTTTTTKQIPVPHQVTAETIEQLILCNPNHTHSHSLSCPICTLSEPDWTIYLGNLSLTISVSEPNLKCTPPLPEPTAWILLLTALNRASKIWAGETVLLQTHLEDARESSSPNPPTPGPQATSSSKLQALYPFIALREQIHLSHALSSLVDGDNNHVGYSARVISHRLGKLKVQIARAGFYARRIIHLHAVLAHIGLGLVQTQTQNPLLQLQGIFSDLRASEARYSVANAGVLQELEMLSLSVAGFRAAVERQLDRDRSSSSSTAEPQPQPRQRHSIPSTSISTIRTALHSLRGFVSCWPPHSLRKVDLVWAVLRRVHKDVLRFEQQIGDMNLLWRRTLLVGFTSTYALVESLITVIRPSEITVARWWEDARCRVVSCV